MFHKVLVPLDRSTLAEQALGQAAAIACGSHGALDIVHVHEPLLLEGLGDSLPIAAKRKDEEQYVRSIVAEVAVSTGLPVTGAVLQGLRIDMICKRVWDVDADLIVMTSHGRTGLSRVWMGSTADGLLRHSATPVLMLRPIEGQATRLAAGHRFKHVLVPLDGSALATEALFSATSLAESSDASITLLRVVVPMPFVMIDAGVPFVYPYPVATPDETVITKLVEQAKSELATAVQQMTAWGIANVTPDVVVAVNVAQAIIDHAKAHDADVIAMSTHGRGASRIFIGSTTDKIIRGSGLPILVHRPMAVRTAAGIAEEVPHVRLAER
jgi:nucleotide-binding universal stress UspA family protein